MKKQWELLVVGLLATLTLPLLAAVLMTGTDHGPDFTWRAQKIIVKATDASALVTSTTMVAAIARALARHANARARRAWWLGVGLMTMLIAAAMFGVRPLNQTISQWNPNALPLDWVIKSSRWYLWLAVCLGLICGALVAFTRSMGAASRSGD